MDTSGGEIVLSPRMLGPKTWVWDGVIPLKSHEWVAVEAVGENCQSVSRISKLNPRTELPFIPKMLFIQEYSTFESLLIRNILIEVSSLEGVRVELEKLIPNFLSAQTDVRVKFF